MELVNVSDSQRRTAMINFVVGTNMPTCQFIRRDGRRCRGRNLINGFCCSHRNDVES